MDRLVKYKDAFIFILFFTFIKKSLLNLLQYCFCFMFWFFGREACGILAPRPGIKPTPPALEGEVLTTGPPGTSLSFTFYCGITCIKCINLKCKVQELYICFLHVTTFRSFEDFFLLSKILVRDFPGGPVVKNPSCNAGEAGSIPGRGTKIPRAVGQLSPRAATTEPVRLN